MSKAIPPSRTLLRCLRSNHPLAISFQCQSAIRHASANVPRSQQSCLNASSRSFSTTSSRTYKTVQEQKSRYKSGPFSWKAGLLFLGSGAGLIFYFRYEKQRMERKRIAEAAKGVGRPKVGGPFELVDQHGRKFGDGDMKGRYSLVSANLFGL
jgi:protein SCO1/2